MKKDRSQEQTHKDALYDLCKRLLDGYLNSPDLEKGEQDPDRKKAIAQIQNIVGLKDYLDGKNDQHPEAVFLLDTLIGERSVPEEFRVNLVKGSFFSRPIDYTIKIPQDPNAPMEREILSTKRADIVRIHGEADANTNFTIGLKFSLNQPIFKKPT